MSIAPILGIYSGFPALFDRRGNAIVVFHPTPYASPAKQWSKAVKDVAALRREIAATLNLELPS